MVFRRAMGSMPPSGSSRMSSSGSCTIACASFTRWRMPLLRAPILFRRVEQVHPFQRHRRRRPRRPVVEPVQPDERGDPLERSSDRRRRPARGRTRCGRRAPISPDRLAEHVTRPLLGFSWPVTSHERGLPRPVWSEQTRDAARDGDRDVVLADHLTVHFETCCASITGPSARPGATLTRPPRRRARRSIEHRQDHEDRHRGEDSTTGVS